MKKLILFMFLINCFLIFANSTYDREYLESIVKNPYIWEDGIIRDEKRAKEVGCAYLRIAPKTSESEINVEYSKEFDIWIIRISPVDKIMTLGGYSTIIIRNSDGGVIYMSIKK